MDYAISTALLMTLLHLETSDTYATMLFVASSSAPTTDTGHRLAAKVYGLCLSEHLWIIDLLLPKQLYQVHG